MLPENCPVGHAESWRSTRKCVELGQGPSKQGSASGGSALASRAQGGHVKWAQMGLLGVGTFGVLVMKCILSPGP